MQATSRNHIHIVKYLLDSKAEVNIKDRCITFFLIFMCHVVDTLTSVLRTRWGCTPLQDAVIASDEQLSQLLKSKGGVMDESFGIRMLRDAAERGDVKMLSLLIKCSGIDVIREFHFFLK